MPSPPSLIMLKGLSPRLRRARPNERPPVADNSPLASPRTANQSRETCGGAFDDLATVPFGIGSESSAAAAVDASIAHDTDLSTLPKDVQTIRLLELVTSSRAARFSQQPTRPVADLWNRHLPEWIVNYDSLPAAAKDRFDELFPALCAQVEVQRDTLRHITIAQYPVLLGDLAFLLFQPHAGRCSEITPKAQHLTSLTLTFCRLKDDAVSVMCAWQLAADSKATAAGPRGRRGDAAADADGAEPSHQSGNDSTLAPLSSATLTSLDLSHNSLTCLSLRPLYSLVTVGGRLMRLSLRGNQLTDVPWGSTAAGTRADTKTDAITTSLPTPQSSKLPTSSPSITVLDLLRDTAARSLKWIDLGFCRMHWTLVNAIIDYLPYAAQHGIVLDGHELNPKATVEVLNAVQTNASLTEVSFRLGGAGCTEAFHERLRGLLRRNQATLSERVGREHRKIVRARRRLARQKDSERAGVIGEATASSTVFTTATGRSAVDEDVDLSASMANLEASMSFCGDAGRSLALQHHPASGHDAPAAHKKSTTIDEDSDDSSSRSPRHGGHHYSGALSPGYREYTTNEPHLDAVNVVL